MGQGAQFPRLQPPPDGGGAARDGAHASKPSKAKTVVPLLAGF